MERGTTGTGDEASNTRHLRSDALRLRGRSRKLRELAPASSLAHLRR